MPEDCRRCLAFLRSFELEKSLAAFESRLEICCLERLQAPLEVWTTLLDCKLCVLRWAEHLYLWPGALDLCIFKLINWIRLFTITEDGQSLGVHNPEAITTIPLLLNDLGIIIVEKCRRIVRHSFGV